MNNQNKKILKNIFWQILVVTIIAALYYLIQNYNNNKKVINENIESNILYEAYNEEIEEFDKNINNKWYETNERGANFKIKGGKYKISTKETSWFSHRIYNLDIYDDFEIETDMRIKKGNKRYATVLFGGAKEVLKGYYMFGINQEGQYVFYKYEDEKWTEMTKSKQFSSLKQGNSWNNIKIVKIGNTVSFYINNVFAETVEVDYVFGSRIGFYLYNGVSAEIERIIVRKINELKIEKDNKNDIEIEKIDEKQDEKQDEIIFNTENQDENNIESEKLNEKIFLNDEFEDNSNDWEISSGENSEFYIKDGKYYISSKQGAWYVSKYTGINTENDFEIETILRKIKGSDKNSFNVMFGKGKGKENGYYVFGISGNGNYRYSVYLPGIGWENRINWTFSEAINIYGTENKIKIYTKNNEIYFEINDKIVNKSEREKLYGDGVGFHVNSGIEIEVDYIRVKEVYSHEEEKNN